MKYHRKQRDWKRIWQVPSIHSILATTIYLSYPRNPARKLKRLLDDYVTEQALRKEEATTKWLLPSSKTILLTSCCYKRYWRDPTPMHLLQQTAQFKARTQVILDQTDKLEVIASAVVDGIHLTAQVWNFWLRFVDDKHKKLFATGLSKKSKKCSKDHCGDNWRVISRKGMTG